MRHEPPLHAAGQPEIPQEIREAYARTCVRIRMRDGVHLYTEVYRPLRATSPRPIVLLRTPYGAAEPDGAHSRHFRTTFRVLAERDYYFVVQDCRGRHGSEGVFEWNAPLRHRDDPDAADCSTDAYDSIEWLVEHLAGNNGRVGMLGVSYPGWLVTMAMIDPHPALAAASPQASPSDYFVGDDFFHHGAFRLSPSADLPYLFESEELAGELPYEGRDTYEFFLELGPLSNMDRRHLRGRSQMWRQFMDHATYDAYWRRAEILQHQRSPSVPTLHVAGWWDAENLNGTLDLYDRLEPGDARHQNRIVVGPWAHGQWTTADQWRLGDYDFGSDTADRYQREIEAPWFAYYLEDEGDLELAEATMFQTGSNTWRQYDTWPPATAEPRDLYLHPDGTASFEAPRWPDGAAAAVRWIADPDAPVPYTQQPIPGFWSGLRAGKDARFQRGGRLWKVEDQRFLAGRPDVATWVTAPLQHDLEVSGRIAAHLFASTTGTDSDWIVKLIDVHPDDYPPNPDLAGYQLMVADEVLRGKFRHGFERPTPITPEHPELYRIDMRSRNHLFRKGHRIMVQVQCSWFPLIDRNPQTFVDIPKASEQDFQRAMQTVHCGADMASRIRLSVVRQAV